MGEFQLRLTSQAARDLQEIVSYIAPDNSAAAERFGLALVEKAELLKTFPICYVRFMLTTDIQQDTYTGPVTLNPRWLRIPSAVKYSGLSRSRLYELIAEGSIKSICLKSHRDASRGVRLVDSKSVDLFMERLQESVSKP
jgi:hypothetical protein